MTNKISCIIVDDEPTAREIIVSHVSKINIIEIVATCKNAIEAFNAINNHNIDLIFLDINMPEISGISFAESINKSVKIIFTTAYRDYAVEGFNLHAVDYLLKPISFERLHKAVHRYIDTYVDTNKNTSYIKATKDFIFVRSERRMIKIDLDSILYIESLSDYVKIYCINQTSSKEIKSIITRDTISNLEMKLSENNFIRIHRSFIINITKISSFTNEEIIIRNKALTISRSYKDIVLNRLENI